MPEALLLDTSALLTLTDREPGVDRVRDLLKAAKRGEVQLHACFITLAEVQYILTDDLGTDHAQRLGAVLVHKDPEMAALGNLIRQEPLPFKGATAPAS